MEGIKNKSFKFHEMILRKIGKPPINNKSWF